MNKHGLIRIWEGIGPQEHADMSWSDLIVLGVVAVGALPLLIEIASVCVLSLLILVTRRWR